MRSRHPKEVVIRLNMTQAKLLSRMAELGYDYLSREVGMTSNQRRDAYRIMDRMNAAQREARL